MQEMRLGASGLYTDPSELEAPKGALREALNVRIKRANTIEPRPGFPSTTISASNGKTTIMQHWAGGMLCVVGTKLYHIIPGGAQTEVVDADAASLSIDTADGAITIAGREAYIATNNGVYYLPEGTVATAYPAGLQPATLPSAELTTGSPPTWLATGNHIAFRVAFSQRLGERLLISAPSDPLTVENTSGAPRSVILTVGIPDEYRADGNTFIQVYRTDEVSTATPVGDEMTLYRSYEVEAADITAGLKECGISPSAFGPSPSLYTNETQQGILQANHQPGYAKCMAWYHRMMFYGNTKPNYTYEIRNDYAFNYLGEDTDVTDTMSEASGVTSITMTGGGTPKIGYYITESRDATADDATFTAFTKITNVVGSVVTIDKPTIGALTGTVYYHGAITIDGTDYVVDRLTSNVAGRQVTNTAELAAAVNIVGDVYMTVTDGDDTALRILSDHSFSVTAVSWFDGIDGIVGMFNMFNGTPYAATAITETHLSRLKYSKLDQPEAVPLTHYVDIGQAAKPILGLGVTRDSLFVVKSDGVWRVTGDTPETLQVSEFDRSIEAMHPRAIATMDDAVWAWTSAGIVGISDSGVQRISDPSIADLIEDSQDNILTYARATTPVYLGGCFVAACQQESVLMVGVPAANTTTTTEPVEYLYVYETRTGAWVRWQSSFDWHGAADYLGGIVLGGPDTLHFQSATLADDEALTPTLSAATANVTASDGVTYPGSVTLNQSYTVGMRITRSGTSAYALFNPSGNTVITDKLLTDGAATSTAAIQCRVEWVAFSGGDPSMPGGGSPARLAHWRGVQLMFGDAAALPSVVVGFASERVPTEATVELRNFADPLRPEPVTLRGSVTRAHARCARLRPSIDIKWAAQAWRLEGVALTFEPMRGGERMP